MSKGQTLDLRRAMRACAECGQRFGADAKFCPFDGCELASVAWDPTGDPMIAKTIDGRYEVVGVLGEGGMGKVYRVRHTSLDRPFAMKVLRKDLARDGELAQRFIQEAKTTASVHHPNIVSITDFGRLPDESPYFVMELLIGETLGDVIKAGGPIPAGRATRIIRQVALALGAAHTAGIVHRDMKPDNVFLVGGMQGGVASDEVRVVDFGAAKILGSSRMTKTGIVFGTPHYMSPEQASGAPVDHRADIYALGIIMYEMFTGRVPFEADTYMGVLTQHMFVNPLPPSQVSPAARELGALEDITLRALEKKPEDRYATMEELAADVDKVVRFSHDRGEISRQVDGVRPRRSQPAPPPFRMADELEPPTLEEMRVAVDSFVPPRRAMPWRWIALAGGGASLLVAGVVAARALREPAPAHSASASIESSAVGSAPAASASAPVVAPSAVSAKAAKAVVLVATPSATVFKGAETLGVTPLTVTVDSSSPAVRYTLKASGFVDQEVTLDGSSPAELAVALQRTKSVRQGAATLSPPAAKPSPRPLPAPLPKKCDPDDPFCKH
jgi:serine/threonine protein kinase